MAGPECHHVCIRKRNATMLDATKPSRSTIPFDAARLDRLMEEAGIDVLVATSKHNVQYLTGGHRAFFFDYMDAMGLSRYLPVFVYPKGAPDKAAFFGHRLEGFQTANDPLWVTEVQANSSGSVDVIGKAVAHIRKAGIAAKRIGAELAFLPVDSHAALRREETNRGLTFEYLLITAGTSLNRAPSEQRWDKGDILSLDSGGNYHGYIGDLCRMAIQGEPDAELVELLDEIEAIQRAAMKPIRAGVMGGEIYAAGDPLVRASRQHNHMHFLAHGMGLVSHEAPRLTASGPVPYDAYDATRPLETGMVVSVETTLQHPKRGFIKLEDTVVVTDKGFEIFGEGGRGWNRGGTAA